MIYDTLECETCWNEYVGPSVTSEDERTWLGASAQAFCSQDCMDRDNDRRVSAWMDDPYRFLDGLVRTNKQLRDAGRPEFPLPRC